MVKNHFVPRFIVKRFADQKGNIFFYSKKKNSVSDPIPHTKQCQIVNFYSNKPLSELKKKFDHISINPLFKDIEKQLEKNLEINVETPMSKILNRIIEPLLNGENINLSPEEITFIKEYIAIQHIRTHKFKEIAKQAHAGLKLPPNIKQLLKKMEEDRVINPIKFVKENFPNLNHKARREKVKELTNLLKSPSFLNGIRNGEESDRFLEDKIKRVEDKLERIRNDPDKHSSEIVDIMLRNSFFKRGDIEKSKIRFVINNTSIPFVLTDIGVVVMCWDYGYKQELRVYLPIHPKISIELYPDESVDSVDEDYVKEFNEISKSASLVNVYSITAEALNLLIND